MSKQFTLPEELVFLGLDKKIHRFKLDYQSHKELYSVGAVFIELLLREVINIGQDGKVHLVQADPTGISYLDQVIEVLSDSSKDRSLKKWILSFYYSKRNVRKKVHQSILESLCEQDVVTQEKDTFLFIIPKHKYVAAKQEQDRIIQRIRAELLEEGPVDEQTVALSFLLKETKMLKEYFSNYEHEQLIKRLEELKVKHESLQWVKWIEKAIDEINLAIAAAGAAAATS
ncbi:GOLPH3/VPS74 family protein [Thermoflavimicrobium dichotomicum]|uniref:Golgi phosphoprotein 3 (GPP34) n=1 Tax=Thermoflavimicrobium dichotomicum TaxID=46223 RepID=A0A1I3SLU6_9BACL|nr:GPP34 family phosphoprotein [Thermoflavimicrobium dichotomicum]SFJ59360.1 Golgi phosphoprotein 3 (GPP34) [Thermoflavimicrobium dichotomicum]